MNKKRFSLLIKIHIHGEIGQIHLGVGGVLRNDASTAVHAQRRAHTHAGSKKNNNTSVRAVMAASFSLSLSVCVSCGYERC